MRKIFSLLLTLLLVTTISSSVYHVAIEDVVYAQLYFQPMEEQPLNSFNNQPLNSFNNQPPQVELSSPQQTPIRKILWTSASWSNDNERILQSDQKDPYDSQFKRGSQGDRCIMCFIVVVVFVFILISLIIIYNNIPMA